MSRVYWSDSEWERLADLCILLRQNDQESPLFHLAQRAQEQFPLDRRRLIQGNAAIQPLFGLVKDRAKLTPQREVVEKVVEKVVEPSDAEALEKYKDLVLGSLTDEDVYLLFRDRVLGTASLEEVIEFYGVEPVTRAVALPQLIGLTAERLCESFGQLGIAELITKQVTAKKVQFYPQPQVAEPVKPVLVRKPKVTIVGCLPTQKQEIAGQLNHMARLRFIDKDHQSRDLAADGADVIVLCSSFIAHKTREFVKAHYPNTPLIEHSGGTKRLVEELKRKLA